MHQKYSLETIVTQSTRTSIKPPRSASIAPDGYRRLNFDHIHAPQLTHNIFRFPAKFHPPVVHSLIRSFTRSHYTLLDPFCGSGTLLVASSYEGRHAIGCDVDPLAVFLSNVKCTRISPQALNASWTAIRSAVEKQCRPDCDYKGLSFCDISLEDLNDKLSSTNLWVPAIPNLFHWFRCYVVLDLSIILNAIQNAPISKQQKRFFLAVFASIIRKSSNADPVPVSGLEVTAHMRKLNAKGRKINVFELFFKAAEKAIHHSHSFWKCSTEKTNAFAIQADARNLPSNLENYADAIITSPPYHNAVDYYRRHKLEMFWLRLTESQEDRLNLLPNYIGRPRVRKRDPVLGRVEELGPVSHALHNRMQMESPSRADAFLHYMVSMKDVFTQVRKTLKGGGVAVFVVGNSRWKENILPTADLFCEIAGASFSVVDKLWYPLKNRHMSYARRNGADIKEEYVLVFQKEHG